MDSLHKQRAAMLSVGSNTVLVIVKLAVGLSIGSVAVVSEAVHSAMDLVAALIAFAAVRASGKPADAGHPFGHGKAENISGAIEALLIFAAAAWIIREAIHKLAQSETLELAHWGAAVMLLSCVLNTAVSSHLFRVARETDSIALEADAWHLRTDVYTSAGVMFALGAIWLGEWLVPGAHFHWFDPVAAIAVALLIVRAAWRLTAESARDLMDASLPAEEEAWIRDYIARLTPTVRGFHRLRTRKAGGRRFIEFHLLVESDMSVEDAHRICDVMQCDIEQRFPFSSVTIHVEPCNGDCRPRCRSGCLLSAGEREELWPEKERGGATGQE
jgi:cation diffusion facilitator family transporter